MMTEIQCEPEQFPRTGSSSCQCTTTWYGEKRKQSTMYREFQNRGSICKKIRATTLVVSLGPGSEKKWYGSITYKPNGEWNNTLAKADIPYSVYPVLWNEENV